MFLNKFSCLPRMRVFWLALLAFCLFLEGVALYYQYVLDYLPCVMCIHVRMLLFALIIVSALGAVFRRILWASGVLMLLTLVISVWMTERSIMLLGVERGWVVGECQMQSGLPAWLALEEWMPWLFKIYEPCLYTPYLAFRISMAEALTVISLGLVFVSLVAFVTSSGPRITAWVKSLGAR